MFADFLIINILNISQNSKNINIINTITDDERRMILETIPKHYAGTGRKIPIPPVLLDALKEHKAKELNNEYVFVKYEKHTRIW